jgi:hypothetical protein
MTREIPCMKQDQQVLHKHLWGDINNTLINHVNLEIEQELNGMRIVWHGARRENTLVLGAQK